VSVTIAETRDITLCRSLRRTVFIDEQGVSEADELDDLDEVAIHLVAREDGQAVGSARLLVQAEVGKIGRVCVLAPLRGRGIGAALIRHAVHRFQAVAGVKRVKLGAQTHALGFYQALGFHPVGEVYDDAGIAHRDMILDLSAPTRAVSP
jgi:ElaA protein